jgi:extradiol dioxygenase family protein
VARENKDNLKIKGGIMSPERQELSRFHLKIDGELVEKIKEVFPDAYLREERKSNQKAICFSIRDGGAWVPVTISQREISGGEENLEKIPMYSVNFGVVTDTEPPTKTRFLLSSIFDQIEIKIEENEIELRCISNIKSAESIFIFNPNGYLKFEKFNTKKDSDY